MESKSHILSYFLSRSDHIRFFVLEYFFGAGGVYVWIRTLGGPLLVFMGINYASGSEKYSVFFGVFCIFFGLFYAFRPIFTVLLNKEHIFDDYSITLYLEKSALHFRNNTSDDSIQYRQITEFSKRKWYYIIKASKNRSIFIPPNQMHPDWMDAFLERRNIIMD
jgi:hypothetical protein